MNIGPPDAMPTLYVDRAAAAPTTAARHNTVAPAAPTVSVPEGPLASNATEAAAAPDIDTTLPAGAVAGDVIDRGRCDQHDPSADTVTPWLNIGRPADGLRAAARRRHHGGGQVLPPSPPLR